MDKKNNHKCGDITETRKNIANMHIKTNNYNYAKKERK